MKASLAEFAANPLQMPPKLSMLVTVQIASLEVHTRNAGIKISRKKNGLIRLGTGSRSDEWQKNMLS
jgi:hypothetical protein